MIKFGIIGLGNMGNAHLDNFINEKIIGGKVVAVCDNVEKKLESAKTKLCDKVKYYLDYMDLLNDSEVDAIIIATPHYIHPTIAIEGFKHNKHVMSEKPAGVYTKAVRAMNEAAEKSDKAFGIMFNQRMHPMYQALKRLLDRGELGELRRVNWIITDWFRSQSYYNSGGWRATWGGEGGGVLLNQDPHQLDLLQWFCGVPKTVYANCYYGKYHNIEVEDDVSAIFEYENGATGAFITTTGDAPGTNRLEITGSNGKVVVEANTVTFYKTVVNVDEYLKTVEDGFSQPEVYKCEIPVKGVDPAHSGILNNFIDHINNKTPLVAPGAEGIKGLTISNAIHLSSWTNKKVEIPLDEDLFYNLLEEKIKTSTYIKPKEEEKVADLSNSYTNSR